MDKYHRDEKKRAKVPIKTIQITRQCHQLPPPPLFLSFFLPNGLRLKCAFQAQIQAWFFKSSICAKVQSSACHAQSGHFGTVNSCSDSTLLCRIARLKKMKRKKIWRLISK